MSYNALSAIMGDQLSQPSPIPHLTNAQLYFVGFAQGWCSKATPQQTRVRVKTDPHSPPRFRVTGSLVNFPSFAQAFNCPVGSPMNPTNRCTVW
jgi:endothelin-converting enzyme